MVYIAPSIRSFALVSSLALLLAGPVLQAAGYAQTAEPPSSPTPESEVPPAPPNGEGDQPTAPAPATDPNEPRFTCQAENGQYTVVYRPQSQPDQSYPWAVPEDMGSAWPADRRCQEISNRLELYRPDGLVEMRTAVENGYNTVCVTTQQVPTCRIVFTVPPGQDALATRDRVFENLAMADRGEMTQGVNTFADGGSSIFDQLGNVLNLPGLSRPASGINLQPFLDQADGGTGTRLTPSQAPAGRPLNPDQFR